MNRSLLALLLFATVVGERGAPLAGQETPPSDLVAAEPGSELRVWLLTAGPGEAVWERFGHNAIRILDTSTGWDVAYNWGIFDFQQVDFIPRFLRGEMLYMMAPFHAGPMVDAYARAGRRIVAQELDLTPAQRLALRDYAEWNALPEHREYFYNYFLDNCSTRVRDLLDRILGGALSDRFADEPSGTTWRDQIRRLTADDPLLFTGMDVLLGTPGDQPISVWEEMFLPMTLRDAVRDVTVTGPDGAARPLVLAEEVLAQGAGAGEPEAPPSWVLRYLVLGAILGGTLAACGVLAGRGHRWAKVGAATLAVLWSLAAGVAGLILVLVLLTDHRFMFANENLFLLNPLSLALAFLAPLAFGRPSAGAATRRVAAAVLAVALLGLALQILPVFRQENAIFFALVLPIHAGTWWALRVGTSDTRASATASRS